MTYANNLDPDEAPQNVGFHLRSKLFDIQIIYVQNIWEKTMIFASFEERKYLKKLPSMQRVKVLTLSLPNMKLSFGTTFLFNIILNF